MDDKQLFLSAKEFSKRLGIQEQKVRRWLRQGLIKGKKVSSSWLVRVSEINRLLSEEKELPSTEILKERRNDLKTILKQKTASKKKTQEEMTLEEELEALGYVSPTPKRKPPTYLPQVSAYLDRLSPIALERHRAKHKEYYLNTYGEGSSEEIEADFKKEIAIELGIIERGF